MSEEGLDDERPAPRGFAQKESSASTTLQMLLHYNVFASALFLVVEGVILSSKLSRFELGVFGQVLTPLCFGMWFAVEVFRLWFGTLGNLQEKLPQLSVFFLLSVFPQLPCLLYLMHLQEGKLPMEQSFGSVLFVMVGVELFFAYMTIQNLVLKQTSTYSRLLDEEN